MTDRRKTSLYIMLEAQRSASVCDPQMEKRTFGKNTQSWHRSDDLHCRSWDLIKLN